MPKFRINVKVDQKGQIFRASATKAAGTRMTTDINEALAQEGVNRAQAYFQSRVQNPTGFYQSNISIQRGATYRGIWDNNVVYGGWLEGVDSRNQSTRFKGYRTFRQTKQSLDSDKLMLAQPMVDRYVREMNS